MKLYWIAVMMAGTVIIFNEAVAAVLSGDVLGYFSNVTHLITFVAGVVIGTIGAAMMRR